MPDLLKILMAKEIIVFPLVILCVIAIVYANSNTFIEKIRLRIMKNRDEMYRIMKLMFVDTTKEKLTQMLMMLSFGLGAAMFLLFWPNFWFGLFIGSVVAFAGMTVPLSVVKGMHEKRCNRLVDQLVDGLTIMTNGISAGLTVTQSMERVVENLSNPISQEFDLVLGQIRMGRPVEVALVEMGDRVPRPDVQMLVTSINILKETGGNMAETFSTISVTIRERQKLEKKIEAMTAQAMTQGMIVSLVPIGLLILFQFMDPVFVKPLFTETLGWILLVIIFGLVIFGGIVMRKMAKIEV
jgi:tight adherence protein B